MLLLTTTGLDSLHTLIVDLLDSIIPVGSTLVASTSTLHEWLAYLIILMLLWGLIGRPFVRLLGGKK